MNFNSLQFSGQIYLKKGRDFSVQKQHPWIFSGAIERVDLSPDFINGSVVKVLSSHKKYLGAAFYNQNASLALRFIYFANSKYSNEIEKSPSDIITGNLIHALDSRRSLFVDDTNCMRLVNAEGDMLPGLIIDRYDQTLVIQSSIISIDLIKHELLEFLIRYCKPLTIYEKSNSSSRKLDGLEPQECLLYGCEPQDQVVQERDRKLIVNVKTGQKTGMFIDQREMRDFVAAVSKNKQVLNCFAYSGAFSVAALKAGAEKVISLDCSQPAIDHCISNIEINDLDGSKHQAVCEDAFKFLENYKQRFDIIIVDPPAFAKGKKDINNALKAYYQINALAIKLLNPSGIFVSCSCSNFVNQYDFEEAVFDAFKSAGKICSLLGRHRQALDHPVLAAHTEGQYLKSLILKTLQ